MNHSNTIGFIGAGRMAQALAGGIVKSYPELTFVISDPDPRAVESFTAQVAHSLISHSNRSVSTTSYSDSCGKAAGSETTARISVVDSGREVFERSQTVFLAVKPQFFVAAMEGLKPAESRRNLVVSVMAGISIARIQLLTGCPKVIRVMPNTPCLVGEGASAVASSPAVNEPERSVIESYLESVSRVEVVDEVLLDAVTGLSGSGPAYVFAFVESLIRAGVAAGLPFETADRLTRQTLLGAATMLQRLPLTPEQLRQQVSSPGGTTMAGLAQLENSEFDSAILRAVQHATARSRELGS